MKNDHLFSIFNRFGLFPQVFGQVNKCPILKLRETKKVLHVVACQIVFILFHGRDWQGRVFKVMKNDHFFMFLSVLVFFAKLLGRLLNGL